MLNGDLGERINDTDMPCDATLITACLIANATLAADYCLDQLPIGSSPMHNDLEAY